MSLSETGLADTTKAPTNGAANKPATVFVDGGSGTTGLGINERLKLQGDVVTKALADDKRKDPAAKKALMVGVRQAAARKSGADKAWAMRDAFDGMLDVIERKLENRPSTTGLPASRTATSPTNASGTICAP